MRLVETKRASPAALTPASITEGHTRPNKASDQHIHADRHTDLKISCSSAGLLEDQPGQHQHQQDAAQYQQLQQPETPASACRSHPSQLMQIQHSGRAPAHAAASPAGAADVTSAIPASGICPSSMLDRVLSGQGMVQELLLPTPTNINPIHLPGDDLLHFVGVQQWVRDTLHISLPLLDGMYVLVPSSSLQQPVLPCTQHTACGPGTTGGTHSSSTTADDKERPAAPAAVCSAIPWRLRQVLRVELAPTDSSSSSSDPADATVVLVGGDRVRAGDVSPALLADTVDYQYLCCELAALQLCGQLRPLQVFDVAHLAWRMRVACDLDSCKEKHNKECADHDGGVLEEEAGRAHLEAASSTLMSLAPQDWVEGQILGYVELNPYLWPSSPDEPWQLLDQQQYSRLMEGSAAAWTEYVRCKHTGQQPQPITDFVPWEALHADSQQPAPAPASPAAHHSQLPPAERQSHGSGMCGGDQGPSRSRSLSCSHAYEHSQASGSRGKPGGCRGKPGGCSSTCSDASASQHRHSRRADSDHRHSRSCSRSRSRSRGRSRSAAAVSYSRSQVPSHHSPAGSSDTDTTSSSSDGSTSSHSSRSRSSSSRSTRNHCRRSRPSRSSGRSRSRSHSPVRPGRRLTRSRSPARFHAWRNPKLDDVYFVPTDPMSQYIEIKVQAWLQQLAALVTEKAGPPEPGKPPCTLALGSLRYTHPLPRIITRHYKSCSTFVGVRPELAWVGSHHSRTFYLKKEYQAQLLELVGLFQASRAAASGGSGGSAQQAGAQAGLQQQQQEQPPLGHDWPEYLAHERQLYEASMAAAADCSSSPEEAGMATAAAAVRSGSPEEARMAAAAAADRSSSPEDARMAAAGAADRSSSPEDARRAAGAAADCSSSPEDARMAAAAAADRSSSPEDARRAAGAAAGRGSSPEEGEVAAPESPRERAAAAASRGGPSQRHSSHAATTSSSRGVPPEVEAAVQSWLQQLAQLLGPIYAGGQLPTISVQDLKTRLPLPAAVLQHYGSLTRVVSDRPELDWENVFTLHAIFLVGRYHRQLLAGSGAAAGSDRQQQGRQQPNSPAGATHSRYLSSRELAKSTRQLDSNSRRQVREWLEDLAELLAPVRHPPTTIKLQKLRDVLPLPLSLKHFYGSMARFVDAQAELAWSDKQGGPHKNYIYLVPDYHRRLLESSSAAGRARKTSKTTDISRRSSGELKGRSLTSNWRAKQQL